MGRVTKQTLFQVSYTDGQYTLKKMLNITNHQGHATKTIMSYHFTPVMVIIKKTTEANAGKDMKKREPVVHCWNVS